MKKTTKKSAKYYAVRNGRQVGIYETWDEAKKQVDGYPDAMFKSFKDRKQAEDFIGVEEVKPVAEIYTAGVSNYGKGSGWYYFVYNKDGYVEDEMGDSETSSSDEAMELTAVQQALRSNQYLANGENETVLLVVRNYNVYKVLTGKTTETYVDDWLMDSLNKLLKDFKDGHNNLIIVTVNDSKKYKPSKKAEAMAEKRANEAVIF